MLRMRQSLEVAQMQLEFGPGEATDAYTPQDDAAAAGVGEIAQTEADGQGQEPPPDGSSMCHLLGEEEFAKMSCAVGASLGRALWRQLRDGGAT